MLSREQIPQEPGITSQSQLNCRLLEAMALTQQQLKEATSRLAHLEARLKLSAIGVKQIQRDQVSLKQLDQLAEQIATLRQPPAPDADIVIAKVQAPVG